ncbi:hypothetical protein PV325_008569 [Microctonus aethiopoides]|nr:hypothetical protein PV325_008569 [Microctonus aethiopoides]KAK0076874.1 hypothetical protein PV326_010474 [Microctonus aethiopoides]
MSKSARESEREEAKAARVYILHETRMFGAQLGKSFASVKLKGVEISQKASPSLDPYRTEISPLKPSRWKREQLYTRVLLMPLNELAPKGG